MILTLLCIFCYFGFIYSILFFLFFFFFFSFVFFFFQAEDGIRDVAVTGVQTCALPISGLRLARPAITLTRQAMKRLLVLLLGASGTWFGTAYAATGPTQSPLKVTAMYTRSEERRVGKECRSRWTLARSEEKKYGSRARR